MTVATTADRIATEGKQAITFLVNSPQPGKFSATLSFSAPVQIEPSEIPVEIEILPGTSDRIPLQFFSEPGAPIDLPANGQWQKVQSAGLSLFYPDRLKDALVEFDGEVPTGVELQPLAGGDPTKGFELGKPVKLATLGRVLGFQVRPISNDVIGKALSARLTVRSPAGQTARVEGTDSFQIPFRFVTAGEVRIETSEIALGQVLRGTKAVKRTLNLHVMGEAVGKKLRVVKKGQGLSAISITPNELILKPGSMSWDLEFAGFDERAPGPIDGEFTLVAEEPATVVLQGGPVVVRGTIPAPGSVIAEIENPMTVGQPFFIRARLQAKTISTFTALVRTPGTGRDHEVVLSDGGSAEDGDAKPNDGIYSGVFKRTEALGTYQVRLAGSDAKGGIHSAPISVPVFFKPPASPLSGQLAKRRPGSYLQFKSQITSDYPETIALHVEPEDPRLPLNTFVSTKRLEAGKDNTVDFVVGLTPEAQPGEYRFKVFLVTDKIDEQRARIPVSFEITVVSFFQYFVRLLAITLAIGGAIFVAIIAPWKKLARVGKSSEPGEGPSADEQGADESYARDTDFRQ